MSDSNIVDFPSTLMELSRQRTVYQLEDLSAPILAFIENAGLQYLDLEQQKEITLFTNGSSDFTFEELVNYLWFPPYDFRNEECCNNEYPHELLNDILECGHWGFWDFEGVRYIACVALVCRALNVEPSPSWWQNSSG